MLRGYNKTLITPANVAKFQRKFGSANVALVTGPSDINVVDIDDRDLLPAMPAPVRRQPFDREDRGPRRISNRLSQRRDASATDLRYTEGLPAEIKAAGSIVIAPPSHNPKTGRNYEFVEGDFSVETLRQLPKMHVPAIYDTTSAAQHRTTSGGAS